MRIKTFLVILCGGEDNDGGGTKAHGKLNPVLIHKYKGYIIGGWCKEKKRIRKYPRDKAMRTVSFLSGDYQSWAVRNNVAR